MMKKIFNFFGEDPILLGIIFGYIVMLFFPYILLGFKIPFDINLDDFIEFMIYYALFLAFICVNIYGAIYYMCKR